MTQSITSFVLGLILYAVNFSLLRLAWIILIFQKKFVALAVPLIVFKYAILGVSLYYAMHSSSIQAGWFVGGIAGGTLSTPLIAYFLRRKKDQDKHVI